MEYTTDFFGSPSLVRSLGRFYSIIARQKIERAVPVGKNARDKHTPHQSIEAWKNLAPAFKKLVEHQGALKNNKASNLQLFYSGRKATLGDLRAALLGTLNLDTSTIPTLVIGGP